jgi:hypothetical protein
VQEANKKIAWEKWRDPYLFDENFDEEDLHKEDFSQEAPDGYSTEEMELEQEYMDYMGLDKEVPSKNMKILMTSFGVLPVTDENSVSSKFNFWTGHTNFTLSASVSEAIEGIEGVEALDVMTRYRFRIAIGKLFKDRDVMFEIQKKLTDDKE